MLKRSFGLLCAAVIMGVGTAAAQTGVPSFNGFYVGGQAGYSRITDEVAVAGITVFDETADGIGGSGFIGFEGTNNNIYGAIEAELGYDGADWSATGGGLTLDVEAQLTYGVGLRVGGFVANRYLIYGRLGWVRTNFEATATLAGVGSASSDADFDGFRFGGGVEGMLGGNVSARAEYTYTIYEDPFDISGVDFDINQHLFRIGMAYHF